MTIYARNDILGVSLSRSHGGCGKAHSRPVENGAPAKLWEFNECEPCERVLRTDPHWSPTISQVPETYDEKSTREDQEKRGLRDSATATSQALTQLASLGDLPAVMAQLVAMFNQGDQTKFQLLPPAVVAPDRTCANGHNVSGMTKFCGECGVDMAFYAPPITASWNDETDHVDDTEPADAPPTTREFLDGLSFAELKDYARTLGVKTARSREDQLTHVANHLGV